MAKQISEDTVEGIDVKLVTVGPEKQDGHAIGSDVLHCELTQVISEVVEDHD